MISIVVPVYNVEKYIIKCLESIENQDYKDYEVILVNDGSKDDSVALIKEFYKDKTTNWKLINKENGGLASARNAGLDVALGEYICFVDSDDCVASNYLSLLLGQITDDIDFSFCNFEFTKEQVEPIDSNNSILELNKEQLLNHFLKRNLPFVVPTMMFKLSFLKGKNLRFDNRIRFSEDQIFIWNAFFKTNKAKYLSRKLYGYYIRESSIMTSTSNKKIVDSYYVYVELINKLLEENREYSDIIKLILPRWKLGTLFTSSKLMNYETFLELYKLMNGRKLFFQLIKIKEIKTYLLSFVSMLSPKLLYTLSRGMK